MTRPDEPAQLVSETVVAECRDCEAVLNDEDLTLILAVQHHQATNHEVSVVTTRTELLKGER